jgi:hypothetical protein
METILDEQQYMVLYRNSYTFLISSVYALYRKHYVLTIVPSMVFLTSINYWRKPDYSWRRYFDMIIVKSMMVYQIYVAYNAEFINHCLILWAIGFLAYYFGTVKYRNGDRWSSVYFHMMFHTLGNLGNLVLYSGYIEPTTPVQGLSPGAV